ncbi:MAG: T9SS type A sorting domain-containing protein [Bacteroidetes bacterium]|nr:T9SS type A sorting domain-containing protein [Bacteroidota bacterium]
MKFFICFAALLFFGGDVSFAQPSTFLKMYNKGNSGYSVRELNGNTYVVAGGTDYYYNYNWNLMSPLLSTNIHLFKTTSNGTLIWEKIFSSLNHRTIATWMEPCNDGGLIVTGHINNENNWPPDSNDIILIKTDANGAISWSKTFDTGKDELGFCVRQTNDNGYIISGFHDAAPTSLTGTTYVLLIKTDSNGSLLWEKKYQIPVRDLDTAEGLPVLVNQTADNGYVVTGTTAASHAADVFVFRTDQAGNLLWAKSYEHDASFFRFSLGLDIMETQLGDLVIAGAMDKNRILNQFNYPYILQISSVGTIINAKIFSTVPDQPFQSGFSSVEETSDGGFFFTGMGGYSDFGNQAQFLKTDNLFNMQWSRVYTMDGIATMGSRSGRSTSDGSYIFTGKRQFSGTVLMKTNNMGLLPCKNPTDLIEIVPSIFVQDRFPTVITGINSTNLVLSTLLSAEDTSTICPVIVSSLPIALLTFTAIAAENNAVQLNWQTASEINSNHFVIQKSFDGIKYQDLGIVKAAGTTTFVQNYSFIDENYSPTEFIYYRLKEIDFNGEQTLSKVVLFHNSEMSFTLINTSVDYSSQVISIFFSSGYSGTISYYLTDMLGQVIFKGTQPVEKVKNVIEIDAHDMPKGAYFFTLNNESNSESGKIFY